MHVEAPDGHFVACKELKAIHGVEKGLHETYLAIRPPMMSLWFVCLQVAIARYF